MKNLITGLWVNENSYILKKTDGKINLKYDTEIGIKVSDKKYCIGYEDIHKGSQTCLENEFAIQNNQCLKCFDKSYIKACLRCIGDTCKNPVRRTKCIFTDHYLYLALYDYNVVKVGVSKKERYPIRIKEQGAIAAISIIEHDGQNIRKFEHLINQSGLKDRINLLPLLSKDYPTKYEALEMLTQEFLKTKHRINTNYLKLKDHNFLYYADIYPQDLNFPPRLINPNTDNYISGKIKGIRGSYLILNNNDENIAVSIKSLIGREILEENLDIKTPKQSALAFV